MVNPLTGNYEKTLERCSVIPTIPNPPKRIVLLEGMSFTASNAEGKTLLVNVCLSFLILIGFVFIF